MSFSLGQFIGGAAAAGVSNADEAIKHRDALDLQQHQEEAAMMRQTAMLNTQNDNSINLMHQTSATGARATIDARNLKVSETATEAQRLADERAGSSNGIIGDKMQAAKDFYTNSDLSDDQKQQGYDAADKYLADNTVKAKPTDMEILHAGVNTGYVNSDELLKMDREQAAASVAARLAEIKDRHEDNNEARVDAQDRHWQGMIAAMNYKTDSAADKATAATKVPESIKEAIWLKENKDDPELMAGFQTAKTAKNKTGVANTPDGMGGLFLTNNDTGEIAHLTDKGGSKIIQPATKGPTVGKVTPPMAALPAGAVQVGTSGGKAVYKLPNGQQMIQQ